MRIKSIRIDRYGPLMGFSRTHLGDFTVVYGPNEYGKTLLIDALIKLLFRKEFNRIAKYLGNIQRVPDPPEGQLILDAKGSQLTIAQGESISDHMDIDPQSFRHIFVVRDSDLSIVDDEKFYARLSERLAGLQTSEIDRIKRIIQQKGRLSQSRSAASIWPVWLQSSSIACLPIMTSLGDSSAQTAFKVLATVSGSIASS